jgi:predicted ATPase
VYGPLVSRRRDVRRYGRGPYVLSLRREPERWGKGIPFDVPAVAHVERLRLGDAPVTLLAGDNGSGYFLRAESFFNIAAFVDGGGIYAPDLAHYGDVPLHQQSHGQSFLALAANRFAGQSLYLLDEPEAALSVSGALALLGIVVDAARAGSQFVIATHSPILLACPEAQIYELDGDGIALSAYDDLEAVRLTRGFLDAPERFIRATLGDADRE